MKKTFIIQTMNLFIFFKDNKEIGRAAELDSLREIYSQLGSMVAPIIHENVLLEHIRQLNKECKEWEAASPGRWASGITEDLSHWQKYGIYTVDQFKDDMEAEHQKNMRKKAYADYIGVI